MFYILLSEFKALFSENSYTSNVSNVQNIIPYLEIVSIIIRSARVIS